uniref:Uncharacterized protein n=1 Tax=Glossina palpalis gambiensis TaxID=67801 RepID=A0A1B0AZR9_9MUSC
MERPDAGLQQGMGVSRFDADDERCTGRNTPNSNQQRKSVHEAFQKGYEIFYATMRQHVLAKNIGTRIQATILRRITFFRRSGSCSRSELHRRNLLGFVLVTLLSQINFKERKWTPTSRGRKFLRAPSPPSSQYSLHSNEIFNQLIKPFMNESEIFVMMSQSQEFQQLKLGGWKRQYYRYSIPDCILDSGLENFVL